MQLKTIFFQTGTMFQHATTIGHNDCGYATVAYISDLSEIVQDQKLSYVRLMGIETGSSLDRVDLRLIK